MIIANGRKNAIKLIIEVDLITSARYLHSNLIRI